MKHIEKHTRQNDSFFYKHIIVVQKYGNDLMIYSSHTVLLLGIIGPFQHMGKEA